MLATIKEVREALIEMNDGWVPCIRTMQRWCKRKHCNKRKGHYLLSIDDVAAFCMSYDIPYYNTQSDVKHLKEVTYTPLEHTLRQQGYTSRGGIYSNEQLDEVARSWLAQRGLAV